MKIDAPEGEVQLLVLAADKVAITGRIVSFAGHYITISCDNPVPADAIVRITWSNSLILGEVYAFLEGKYTVVIHIRHAIALDEIDEIRSRWE